MKYNNSFCGIFKINTFISSLDVIKKFIIETTNYNSEKFDILQDFFLNLESYVSSIHTFLLVLLHLLFTSTMKLCG